VPKVNDDEVLLWRALMAFRSGPPACRARGKPPAQPLPNCMRSAPAGTGRMTISRPWRRPRSRRSAGAPRGRAAGSLSCCPRIWTTPAEPGLRARGGGGRDGPFRGWASRLDMPEVLAIMTGWSAATLASGGLFSAGSAYFAWVRIPAWRACCQPSPPPVPPHARRLRRDPRARLRLMRDTVTPVDASQARTLRVTWPGG